MLDAALEYAARGWHVLPITPRGKIPRTAHGLHNATTQEVVIRGWWQLWPEANVGIRTGAVSGLVVLDVDDVEALRDLVRRHGRFDALWVKTGNGGFHAYLAHPRVEVRNSAGKLGPGLDVRAANGYVVAPPSIHSSGGQYRWLSKPNHGWHLPAMPEWMLDMLKPPEPIRKPVELSRRQESLSRYAVAAVEGEARAVADSPVGQRNHQLNISAFKLGQLIAAGMVSEAEVEHILVLAAQASGLSEQEARTTIRSGLRAGLCQPRQVAS